jgi:hypothetical protein
MGALAFNTTASNNTAVGYQAAYANTTGSVNVAMGVTALYTNTTGRDIAAVGASALLSNTTGSYNTAFGSSALEKNTTASTNTAVGYQAGYNHTTGGDSVFLGWQAGKGVTTGANNICIGSNSGNYITAITTGGQCIYLGTYTTASSSSVTYEIVVGYAASGKGANTGFINSLSTYNGANTTTWNTTSDQRLKKNIVDNTDGLDIINKIQVRNFEYRLPEEITEVPQEQAIKKQGVQLGVIAQELQQILPECVKTESTGVMTVDADNLTWYLVNAVKELSARIKQLEGN